MRHNNRSISSLSDLFRPNKSKQLSSRDLSNTRLNLLKHEIQTDSHIIPLKDLYEQLGTDPKSGMTSARAAALLDYYGPNTLTPASQDGWPRILFISMCSGFSILIWIGALLCLVAYTIEASQKNDVNRDNLYLGCVLMAVDILCGLFTFSQTYKSSKIMKTFNSMIPTYARCLRDGVINPACNVRDLVKGDIVHVYGGDVVPADIRIIESKGFKVDNSSLTGESVAVSRSNAEGTNNILESPNVAFFSTLCVEGHACGVVICCGDLTALGRVAGLASRLQPEPSPLSREIRRLMRTMSFLSLTLGLIILISSLALGYPLLTSIVFVIGIIVANVPEGLQPTVTAALTLTAQEMVKKNCLVKNLESIEALGACSTICSDKTGTLTENKMCVRDAWMWNKVYNVIDPDVIDELNTCATYSQLRQCGALCSTATYEDGEVRGDASEAAILTFLLKIYDPLAKREEFPKVAEVPFNSTNKYQVSVHKDRAKSSFIVVMKGAPEIVVPRCSHLASDSGDIGITRAMRDGIFAATDKLAASGERVFAFADLPLSLKAFPPNFSFDSNDVNFPVINLRFLGLIGLMDPPRKEVSLAIKRVRDAGVRVLMVTGDHPLTARAIAAEVGIATSSQCRVVTGNELRQITPDLLDNILAKHFEIVFARTSPTQKLQIVEACQRRGEVVAVTGDGVNDAPALRKADIGISMGITGSQVSKQTADIILMDDNFATIVVGIEEGRKIFDNLKKAICYILISNVPELVPVFMFILCSIPLPLGAMTILCVDLGTDMWPAVAMSHEQAETDVMARPPRNNDPLLSTRMMFLAYCHLGLIEVCGGFFAYFVVMAEYGFYPGDLFGIRERWDNEAVTDVRDSLGQEWTYKERKTLERASQSSYFVAVVLMQITNGVICRTRYNSVFQCGLKNRAMNIGVLFEMLLAAFLCYTPGVNEFFGTYPIKLRWWFLALPFCAYMFTFDELRKYCIRRQLFNGWFNRLTYY